MRRRRIIRRRIIRREDEEKEESGRGGAAGDRIRIMAEAVSEVPLSHADQGSRGRAKSKEGACLS